LLTFPGPEAGSVRFAVAFAAADEQDQASCAAAYLDTGDDHTIELGLLCAPTPLTWRQARQADLATHGYGGGPFTARLRWGESHAEAIVGPGRPAASALPAQPELPLFAVESSASQPLRRVARVKITGLRPEHQVRLDGGNGQTHTLTGADGPEQSVVWTLDYPKPGPYLVALDLLDAGGFWLATLAETPLEVAPPAEVPAQEPAVLPQASMPLPIIAVDVSALPAEARPWLPYRYARPAWGWSRTYTAPGGGQVSRAVGSGTYLSIRQETVVNAALWYRTGSGDWIAANAVSLMTPSELRGVALGETAPPPPPPPPADLRRGVVTATVLNVRGRPGVRPDNPPIAQLRAGDEVAIYEEAVVDAATWYRIGEGRWVHSNWVRLKEGSSRSASRLPTAVAVVADPPSLPVGWVVASGLHVRGRPGVSADNPPVDQVLHNQMLPILETRAIGGVNWYRIGEDRWVEGTWVGVARFKPRPSSIGPTERWVGVNLQQQTAVAYQGDRPVYAALTASGLPGTPTVQGIFRTWRRLDTGKMSGGNPAYNSHYYIEDVTWTCYFYSGYALHTAYWHDAFGRPRSHGCVNLSPYDAWWIYQWSAAGGANSPAVYAYWT
jgi:hypothetical protein